MANYVPLTVAIPTMRRWNFLREVLPRLLEIECIEAIVICDETGEDALEIWSSDFYDEKRIHVFVNSERLGIFENKRRCLEYSFTDWVLLMDSDNEWTKEGIEQLQRLFQSYDSSDQSYRLAQGALSSDKSHSAPDPKTIYAAGGMIKRSGSTGGLKPLSAFGGLTVKRENWNDVLKMPGCYDLLNDGNFIINRRAALPHIPRGIPHETYYAADVIACLYGLLRDGGMQLRVEPELWYYHNVHEESSWLQTAAESWSKIAGKFIM